MSQQLTSMSQRIWFELATKHPQKIRERQELVALIDFVRENPGIYSGDESAFS